MGCGCYKVVLEIWWSALDGGVGGVGVEGRVDGLVGGVVLEGMVRKGREGGEGKRGGQGVVDGEIVGKSRD